MVKFHACDADANCSDSTPRLEEGLRAAVPWEYVLQINVRIPDTLEH